MTDISRRRALASLFAVTGFAAASLLALDAAHADGVPETSPGAPRSSGPRNGGLKAEFTPSDREMNRRCINKTLDEAPAGKTWSWNNPKTGNGGTVTPTSPRPRAAGEACRNFTETVTLKDGRTETISGRACRRRDGSWSVA